MLEMTGMYHDWIDICPWGMSNEAKATERIEQILKATLIEHLVPNIFDCFSGFGIKKHS